MKPSLLVLGIGNPGRHYQNTRHNVGFCVLDELARRSDAVFRARKNFNYAWASFAACELFLCKPSTYVNDSGRVFPGVFSRSGMKKDHLLVVADTVDLPVGKIRVKADGGKTTHNGIRSIVTELGDGNFMRLYLGIGSAPFSLHSHVLGSWPPAENAAYTAMFARAADAVLALTQDSVAAVQSEFN